MPSGNISNYQGGTGVLDYVRDGGNTFILVYNDLDATINNGDIYNVVFISAADDKFYPTLVATATDSVGVTYVGVVNNWLLESATILDNAWGYVQIEGYCEKVATTGTIIDGDYLKAQNASQVAAANDTSGSTALSAKTFGISKSTAASNVTTAILFGRKYVTV